MPKNLVDTGGRPLLDIASYARRGPGRRDQLSPAEIELIQRTVNRTPEVMVKVLSRGANTLKASGVTVDEMRAIQWVKPELVAQIRFVEWTAEGRLRHAAFLGLRQDKSARDVGRE
jgi:hypothetical protein